MKRPTVFDKTRPRVVINALHAKSGGGVTYLQNILSYFAEDPDLEFHLFLHEDQYALFAPIPERIHLHLLDFKSGLVSLLLWEQLALPILAKLMSADVTFSPANYGPLMAPRTVILLRNALSVASGERRIGKRLYWLGVALITMASVLTSRRAITVSNYARRQLTFGAERFLGNRTTTIYHGVSSEFRPDRQPDEESPFILAVADIYVQKNLHGLINAMPAVADKFPSVRLKIAGRPIDNDYYNDIIALAQRRGMDGRIDYLGYCPRDRLIELYNRCKLLVFPSTVETFGNPLVEAMACGVPIASSNSSAMPEIVRNAAIFFDPLEPEDIAARIVEVLEKPEIAAHLSAAGIERSQDFSWERTARETCKVLKEAARNDRNA
jgi:glycosyltransferase involved in cell wall biosynthesis